MESGAGAWVGAKKSWEIVGFIGGPHGQAISKAGQRATWRRLRPRLTVGVALQQLQQQ